MWGSNVREICIWQILQLTHKRRIAFHPRSPFLCLTLVSFLSDLTIPGRRRCRQDCPPHSPVFCASRASILVHSLPASHRAHIVDQAIAGSSPAAAVVVAGVSDGMSLSCSMQRRCTVCLHRSLGRLFLPQKDAILSLCLLALSCPLVIDRTARCDHPSLWKSADCRLLPPNWTAIK